MAGKATQITTGNRLESALISNTKVQHQQAFEQSLGKLVLTDTPSPSLMQALKSPNTGYKESMNPEGNYEFSFIDGGGDKGFQEVIISFDPGSHLLMFDRHQAGCDSGDIYIHQVKFNSRSTKEPDDTTIAARIIEIIESQGQELARAA